MNTLPQQRLEHVTPSNDNASLAHNFVEIVSTIPQTNRPNELRVLHWGIHLNECHIRVILDIIGIPLRMDFEAFRTFLLEAFFVPLNQVMLSDEQQSILCLQWLLATFVLDAMGR